MNRLLPITTILGLSGCTLKYSDDIPEMFDVPALTYPSFPVVRSGKNVQALVEKILSESREFTRDEKLDAPEVCGSEVPSSKLPRKFKDITEFAKVSTAHLSEIYGETVSRVKRTHPEFKLLVDTINKNQSAGLEMVETGVLWGMTELFAKQYCVVDKVRDRASLSLALVHWASSDEAIYSTFFKAFGEVSVSSGPDMFWFRHTTLEKTLNEQVGVLKSTITSNPEGFYTSTNAKVSISGGSIPVKCEPDIEVASVKSPNMTSSGPLITKDSQFYLQMKCKNTSSEKMLMSESITKQGKQNSCLFDPSSELVFPEINPGEEVAVRLGPYLLSQKCEDDLNIRYKLASTHHSDSAYINVSINPIDTRLSLSSPGLDQDMPGHSDKVSYKEKGISNNKSLEMLLSASLDDNYSLYFRSLTVLPTGRVRNPFKGGENAASSFTKFLKTKSTFTLYNDIDLKTVSSSEWNLYFKDREREQKDVNTVYTKDNDKIWFETRLTYLSSCESTASYLMSPVDSLYKLVCEDVSYKDFNSWIGSLYAQTCSSQTIRKQLMELETKRKTEASVGGKVAAKLAEKEPVVKKKEEKKAKPFSRSMFIDPDYDDVMESIDVLLKNNVISASELATALKYSDKMKYLPFDTPQQFSRETGRQLVMAAALVQITLKILGEDADLSEVPIYSRGSAISITKLEAILLDIQLKQSLAEQKNIKSSTDKTRNMLQEALLTLVELDECQSKSPLPKNPPREVRTVSRYFTLPLYK